MSTRAATTVLFASTIAMAACKEPPIGTLGATCPNDRNCIRPLRCIGGTCQMPVDDGMNDAGAEVEDAGNNPPPDAGEPDAGEQPPEYEDAFGAGTFTVTAQGMTLGYDQLAGRAGIIREETGYTNILVFVSGLNPDAEYGAHVHAQRCNVDEGGPHYQIDETVMDVMEENEMWPTVRTNADGDGTGYVRVDHYARDNAYSVVIHETGTPDRIACADLTPNADVTASGTLYELPAGSGSGITGTASLRRYSGGTVAKVDLAGTLQAGATYPAHVHAQRCDDGEGGGHYKIDTTIADPDEANEIWPAATVGAAGDTATGEAQTPHIARYEAWSIVVHDPDTGDKLLCADLRWQ